MTVWYVVDRIEGEYAIIESDVGATYDVPLAVLGRHAREGAVLRVPGTPEAPAWELATRDLTEEAARRERAAARLRALRDRDPGGDLVL
jgi:hypothetical protein